MPMNEQLLANEIAAALNQEMGGGGKDVDKYRRKLGKAIAKAVINHLRANLNGSVDGSKHF